MGGGLIQIASYGIHDKYLISNPEITFFKIVFKKHTNFSMEYLEESFDGSENFGTTNSCVLSKTGDLLHKIYLKIELPRVSLNKLQYSYPESNQTDSYILLQENYKRIQNFINIINYNIIQPLYKLLNINNLLYLDINNKYISLLNKINYNNLLYTISNIIIKYNSTFRVFLSIDNNIINENTDINIKSYLDFDKYYNKYILNNPNTNYNILLKFLLDKYILQLNLIKTNFYELILINQKFNKIRNRKNICFSWVEYLGHQIINKLEIEIGGKVIDFTDSARMHIQYQLTSKLRLVQIYDKLIGNVPELTTFDSNVKPAYTLYIPLDFWFSKYSGLSLPLIFLRYHDVKINLKLNDLINCCYYENLQSKIYIENFINLTSVSLLLNYIYLDSEERDKFGQFKHEYLIDQTQVLNFTASYRQNINLDLQFFNPIKQLFWIARNKNNKIRLKYFDFSNNYYIDIYEFSSYNYKTLKITTTDKNISNYININDNINIINSIYYNGIYTVINIINEFIFVKYNIFPIENYKYNFNSDYTQTSNYTANSQAFLYKIIDTNPIINTSFEINGVVRFTFNDGIYTNFVQPYQHNSKSPNIGLNTYSFALNPEDYQPSGFCNFSRLNYKMLTLGFQDNSNDYDILVYTNNYNILKFEYGKAAIILNI